MSQGSSHTNRLAQSSSPYLLLHQHNPVDWYPWGEEALQRARAEDRPIFLSVGYSTCYWCHVMERESFSDPAIATLMNAGFVNIKVDREERPELDEIYMAATQALTGQGGWPNSVFLTPELKPFFAGTYFPPEDRHGRPGFPTVLRSMTDAWSERRTNVEEQAGSLADGMRRHLEERLEAADAVPSTNLVERAFVDLERRFDPRWGGFGGAPKFPTPSNLYLLADLASDKPRAAEMLTVTLDQMARGGIYDQLAGGFHRYATDAEWKIPHFEKMLYDNAFLLELYALEWERTANPEARRVVQETVQWLDREMTSSDGAFWSAQDAETDGHEGAFHVWTREQLVEALGEEDFGFLAPILGFDGEPFFEERHYVLHLPQPLAVQAGKRKMKPDELLAAIQPLKDRLLKTRGGRKRPLTDDKILTDWNGMMIAGLATAGRVLDEPDYVDRAGRAASFLLQALRVDGELRHTWRSASASVPAFLGDYVHLARGLLALRRAAQSATESAEWLSAAIELTEEQIERLRAEGGGFFVAGKSADVLFRSQEVLDGAVPGANAVAVLNLLELHEVTGSERWLRLAEDGLKAFALLVERVPEAARMMTRAVLRYHRSPPLQS